MDFFLSSETEGRADGILFPIRNDVDLLLNVVRQKNYGNALTSIGIFAIIMKENMYDSGGYPERRYYNKKNKEADIRLRLNYKKFCFAKTEDRLEMYKHHILQAVDIAADMAKKADCEFKKDELIDDVRKALNISKVEEKKKTKNIVIYLAGITEEKSIGLFREVVNEIDPMLDAIRAKDYGKALEEAGIFAIIMKEDSYEGNRWTDKRYYSSIKRKADVRLRINYRDFVYAKPEQRIDMYKKMILKSFEIIVNKIKNSDNEFKGEELLSDINEVLGKTEVDIYWI